MLHKVCLALLLSISAVGAQYTELAPHEGLTWDRYDVELHQIDGYHIWYYVNGGPIQLPLVLPIKAEHQVVVSPRPDPLPPCCLATPYPEPDCVCSETYQTWWWPMWFSHVRKIDAPVGSEVCVYLTAYREVGNPEGPAESSPSSVVCFLMPAFCEFSTREELEQCSFIAPPDGGMEGLVWDASELR